MLREILKRILTEWPKAISEPFADHPLAHAIRQELREAISSILSEKYPNYIISGSAGAGNWANVPWLSILNPEITKSTQDGIYPVYLFRADGTGVYLSLNQGATTPQKLLGKAKADLKASSLVIKLRSEVPKLASWGEQQIELAANTALGRSYEMPNIAARFYAVNSLPSEEVLRADLLAAMKIYEDIEPIWRASQQSQKLQPSSVINQMRAGSSLDEFREQSYADFAQAGLRVSDGLLLRLGASLLAKRFLILTGLSGSGKTKLAHAFASWLTESEDQYRLVAVGADWTTNENVVGYQDALQPEIYRKPSNGLLEVILRAATDADRPYFLILDEMNLSHVERYFADILSAIESGREIALHAAAGSLKSGEGDTLPVPPRVCLPKNLFIIGTVNVDETTYMFSPKVLDRANVIEFRATADDIAAFLDAPAAVNMELLAGKGAAFGAAFVAEAAAEVQLKSETAAELKAQLAEVFAALAPIGAEFGFRTAYEITRFAYYHGKLAGADWQFSDALDAQVLQKLMPKLHGSQRRLEPVLKALEEFCAAHQCNASLEKIRRMQDRLKDGFTSFAEA